MWESSGCSFGGQALIAIVIVFNGRAGAKYHMLVPLLFYSLHLVNRF
jgi:NCS1 family nucleobase:cation symporter-1